MLLETNIKYLKWHYDPYACLSVSQDMQNQVHTYLFPEIFYRKWLNYELILIINYVSLITFCLPSFNLNTFHELFHVILIIILWHGYYSFFFFNFFFSCGPLLKSLFNLLQYCFCFMFWFFGREACGILAPRPGIEPAPPALEGEVLTTGLPGKSLDTILIPINRWGNRTFRRLSILTKMINGRPRLTSVMFLESKSNNIPPLNCIYLMHFELLSI